MEGNEGELPMETDGILPEKSSSLECFVCTGELAAQNSTDSQSRSFAFESFCKLFHIPENLLEAIEQTEHKFCKKCLDLIAVAEGKVKEIELLENNLLAIKQQLKGGILSASTCQSPSENKDRLVLVNWLNGAEGRITARGTECRQGAFKMDSSTDEEILGGTTSRQHHEKSASVEVVKESSGSFQCSFCPRSFQSERARMVHARVHSRGQPLSCPLCNVFCTSSQKFKRHFSRCHSDISSTVCSRCKIDLNSRQVATSLPQGQTSAYEDEISLAKLHAEHAPNCVKDPESEANEGAYECRKCNFRCKRKAQLTRHELSAHEKDADNEEIAEEEGKQNDDDDYAENVEFSAENFNESVLKTPAETPFKCFYCPKSFATENARNGHGKIHGDRKPFQCQLCNVGFGTLTKFKIHLSQKHRDASEKICPLCNSDLTTQTEGGHFQCPTDGCLDTFESITKLRAHHFIECAERIQSMLKPSCSKCSIIFGSLDELNDHINGAHPEQKAVVAEGAESSSQPEETAAENVPEDYKVPQINTSIENSLSNVSRKTTVKVRKRSNRSTQPYRCKICGERFSQLYGLKRHFRIHGKALQISCPLCGITFKPETSTAPSDSRIFKCPLRKCCDRVFDSLSAIRAHHFLKCSENPKVKEKIRIVKNILTCDHCSQSFISAVQLKEHSCTDPSDLNSGLKTETPLKEFQCSTCNKRFITEARRDEHMKLHQNSKAYVCKICKHRFTLSKNLRRHVVQVHRSNAQYMCHHCGEDFHVGEGEKKSFRCHLYDCDQTFETLADLRSHHFLKCPENPELKEISTAAYSCDKCARIFSTEACLRAHIANVHEKPGKADSTSGHTNSISKSIKCPLCPKTFMTEAGLNQHVKIHPNAKPFTCRFCPAEFTRLKSLRRHFATSHAELSESACEFCGDNFTQSQDESGQFKCNSEGCFLVFDTVAQLRSHHLQKCPLKADKALEDGYTCDRCGKSFLGSTALKDHIASIHEKTFKFYCELCGRGFQKVCELKRHSQFVHSTEKRFECDVCKMRFKRSNQLFYHRRMHTGERPYICEICGKSFHIPGKLRLHVALHSGKKEFPCPICGKLFASKNYVTYHINFTHKGRARSKKKPPTEVILEMTTSPALIETVIEFQPITELEVHTEPLPTFEHITVETDDISTTDPM